MGDNHDEDADEIPDEEKLAIATHFMMSSPPGEIGEVLKDVKTCLNPPSLLTDSVLEGIFRKYNTQNFEVIETDQGPVLLSDATELEPGVHIHSQSGKSVKVDHVQQTGTVGENVKDIAMKAECEAIQKQLNEYLESQYVGGASGKTACSVVADKDKSKQGNIIVQISGQKTNLRNFWSGKWRSEWQIDTKKKKASGYIRSIIHYFEDANVQMETKKDVPSESIKPASSSADDLAKAVKEFVVKQEQMVQDTLEEIYNNMSQESFKDMRRVLPITRSKMDWTGAQSKLAASAGAKKQ